MIIYALFDSDAPGNVRYIGKTGDKRLPRRLSDHLRAARRGASTHRAQWIRAVLSGGRTIEHAVIAYAATAAEANRLECHYIALFRSLGFDLTNGTDGGDGQSAGYQPTAATRERLRLANGDRKPSAECNRLAREAIRSKPRSAEWRAKQRAAQTGSKRPGVSLMSQTRIASALQRAKAAETCRARNSNPEHIAKSAAARTGSKHSEESRAKMSAAHRNISEETRRKMALAQTQRWARARELAATQALNLLDAVVPPGVM